MILRDGVQLSFVSLFFNNHSSHFYHNLPELLKFKSLNLQYAYKILTISSLNGPLSLDKLKINLGISIFL